MTDKSDTAGTTTPARVLLKNRDAVRAQIALLAGQARHEVLVFAPLLDPYLFNTAELSHLLASFAARDRHNLVHILIEDVDQAIHDNDRIVMLCRRLSDFVQMRRVGEQHKGLKEMFVVTDHHDYLHQSDTTRPECLAAPADAHIASELRHRFREMWERSEPIAALRTTGLA